VEMSRRSRRNARSSAFASGITSNFELNADLLEVTYLSEWTTSACPVHIGGATQSPACLSRDSCASPRVVPCAGRRTQASAAYPPARTGRSRRSTATVQRHPVWCKAALAIRGDGPRSARHS
jgi:hypothetical protein